MASVWTVSQLNTYTAALLGNDAYLRKLQVRGEVSGGRQYPSGHFYFTLKDELAAVSCVMFASRVSRLTFKPENGTQVIVQAQASIYERDGRFQLIVQSMTPEGQGDLHRQFEELKKRLSAEGLFDEKRKQPLLLCRGALVSLRLLRVLLFAILLMSCAGASRFPA